MDFKYMQNNSRGAYNIFVKFIFCSSTCQRLGILKFRFNFLLIGSFFWEDGKLFMGKITLNPTHYHIKKPLQIDLSKFHSKKKII